MIVFVQPFGLSSPGGGPRILRALLQDAQKPFLSVCTSPSPPPPTEVGTEVHLPARRHRGRVESTRFGPWLGVEEIALIRDLEYRLENLCEAHHATALHGLSHSIDFWPAYCVARKRKIPFYLSVHDDLGYSLQGRPDRGYGLARLGEVWKNAQERFVISEEMGREYSRRYGKRSFLLITDGLTTVPNVPQQRPEKNCRIYFMGLFHYSYGANLRALLQALERLQEIHPDIRFSVTCRSGSIAPDVVKDAFPVTILPFASEQEVAEDMKQADFLYLPLPFSSKYESFLRYSLSTKMITYLGSGLPILYHGPAEAAAGALLAKHDAAISICSLDPAQIAKVLHGRQGETTETVCHALTLGRHQFLLQDIRNRFWGALAGRLSLPCDMMEALLT